MDLSNSFEHISNELLALCNVQQKQLIDVHFGALTQLDCAARVYGTLLFISVEAQIVLFILTATILIARTIELFIHTSIHINYELVSRC